MLDDTMETSYQVHIVKKNKQVDNKAVLSSL